MLIRRLWDYPVVTFFSNLFSSFFSYTPSMHRVKLFFSGFIIILRLRNDVKECAMKASVKGDRA